MNSTTSSSAPEPTVSQKAAALGGITVRVTLLNGLSEEVWVKQLPLRQMPDYAAAVDNPATLIRLCTGKADEWVDRLSAESFEALALKCDEVNSDFFSRWVALAQRRGANLSAILEKAGVSLPAITPTLRPS